VKQKKFSLLRRYVVPRETETLLIALKKCCST
jgi:hypothetical protein